MLQRLKNIRKTLGFTQMEFARQLGITQTAYSMIENGIRALSDKHIQVICTSYNVSERFLLMGEGEMFQSSPYEKELILRFRKIVPDTQEYLIGLAKELLEMQQNLVQDIRLRSRLPISANAH